MSSSLFIKGNDISPQVYFDVNKCIYEINGRSMSVSAISTFQTVLDWVANELPGITNSFTLALKFQYLNSSSSKMVGVLLSDLETQYLSGKVIDVEWYFDNDDEDIQALGDEFVSSKKMPIKLIGVDDMSQIFRTWRTDD
ncbi:MAG: DUF1987 domain-containing protein [Salinivirgaceae bacterium]|nr:DUF1987 domain-containing protein [Salinivirgaceae bacterium]